MTINYTYKDSGRQLMILDLEAHVSLAGISWMQQYLQEFGLTIEQMNSILVINRLSLANQGDTSVSL